MKNLRKKILTYLTAASLVNGLGGCATQKANIKPVYQEQRELNKELEKAKEILSKIEDNTEETYQTLTELAEISGNLSEMERILDKDLIWSEEE